MSEEQKEWVDHPKHYIRGKFEHVVVVEDWQLGYHLGNATKYVMRAGHKDDGSVNILNKTVEDLEKGRWYTNRARENILLACSAVEVRAPTIALSDIVNDWADIDDIRVVLFSQFRAVQYMRNMKTDQLFLREEAKRFLEIGCNRLDERIISLKNG